MTVPSLSIIIVNWNSANYLDECLTGLFQRPPSVGFEVIVVDNNSSDNSLQVLGRFPKVRVISNRYNYGFAVANNQAFRQSVGQFVMTLNPDTLIDGSAIDKLIELMRTYPDVGLVAPVTIVDGKPDLPLIDLPLFPKPALFSLIPAKLTRSTKRRDQSIGSELLDVRWVLGTGYVCRRTALLSDKFFVEDFFLFAEEFYLSEQIRRAGFRLVVTSKAKIEHFKSVTFKNDPARSFMANKLLTAALWVAKGDFYGFWPALVSQVYIAIDNLIVWSLVSLKYLVTGEKRIEKKLQLIRSKSLFVQSLKLILLGRKGFDQVNREALVYFNQGVEPPFPPLQRIN